MYSVPSWPDIVTLFESQMSACTFLVSVRRVICYLEMVIFSGNYPSRCTWRRKPYAHDINHWVMPGPGVDVFQESASFSLAHILVASPNSKELLSCVLHVKTVSCREKEICHSRVYTVYRVQTLKNIILPSVYRFSGLETYWHPTTLQPESKVVCMP